MRSLRLPLAASLVFLVTRMLACGGSSSQSAADAGALDGSASQTTCTATISGATMVTMPCFAQAGSGDTANFFEIDGFDASGHELTAFFFLAAAPQATTYTAANVQSGGGIFQVSFDGGGPSWMMNQGGDAGAAGTFSLDVSDLGPSAPGKGGSNLNEVWSSPHGSYEATYDADAGSSASGPVTVNITF
ncbi:MAG: hypothetical protein ABI183_11550 [Polyangiaceae bacterium]